MKKKPNVHGARLRTIGRLPGAAIALLCLALAATARAAPEEPKAAASPTASVVAPAPVAATPSEDERLRLELEQAIKADAAKPGAAPAASTATAAAPAAAPSSTPLARGTQSLNPDLSAIIDATSGYQSAGPAWAAGDDPAVPRRADGHALGFTVQEVEIALSAVVDPYLKGEVYLTIPNLSGLEIEEAVATTTSLPWNLQIRAGSFRGAFGRQNGQHLHVQDFTTRPLINAAFLGSDGMRGPGAQLSWLTPAPFFLTLFVEGFSFNAPGDNSFATFGGRAQGGLTGALHAKAFFPVTDSLSLYAGLSAAAGHTNGVIVPGTGAQAPYRLGADVGTQLYGGDLYVKWKPPNESGGYTSVAWVTEVIFRSRGEAAGPVVTVPAGWDGGLYSQVVVQLARRFFLGLRGDLLGLINSRAISQTVRGTASITFQMSEFARLRAEGYAEHYGDFSSPADAAFFAPDEARSPHTAAGALLQLELSIGAHGAHAF